MLARQPTTTDPASQTGPSVIDKINYHERIALVPRPAELAGSESPPVARTHTAGLAPGALVLAALQLVVGYQWLVSGVDKLLGGGFPDHLGTLVSSVSASDRLPAFFAQFLQQVVLPNSYLFGLATEVGETLIGVGLLGGAMLTLVGPALLARSSRLFLRRIIGVLSALTIVAAVMSLALGANYYVLDGMPTAWFQPGFAFGGAIDSGLFLALSSLVILLGRVTVRPARQAR